MIIREPSLQTSIEDGIRRSIKERIERVWEEQRKELNKRINEEKAHCVAGHVLYLSKYVNYEKHGDVLRIEVRLGEPAK